MKYISLVLFCAVVCFTNTHAQCTYSFPNNLNTTLAFSVTGCGANTNVVLNNVNSNPGGAGNMEFTNDITLASLTINFANGNQPAEFIIPAGVTVTITGNLIFTGQVDKDKFLTINGTLIVDGTLDFGNLEFEIDGTGSISAGQIIGSGDTTCSTATGGTGTCPTITTPNCSPAGPFCNTELPIELLFFKSNIISTGVQLNWATAKEDNFDYFSVERSRNGHDFEEIAQVKGAGFSRSILNYSTLDAKPLNGRSYYRLKAIDLDETFEYSSIIAVNTQGGVAQAVQVSPNPLEGDRLNIISANLNEEARVFIYDLAGTLVRDLTYTPGTELELNGRLNKGVYIVTVSNATYQGKTKLIVK